ncbi:MAG: hypothetical protein PUG68_10045 [Lachnospiraceae bacterium]|nr:hypothetical protein [Lachnospiraceae bacterium]MDD7328115.1 hypothetical protein [Lachnospiraceae bacterium]MDY2760450.1 hypothetical protein [Lachnospiraceae bacterium]
MDNKETREELRKELIDTIVNMGYPAEFGQAIAEQLGTEMTMNRMIGYLHRMQPQSAEEIADEMLAICDDRDRWRKKKEAEFYNQKYNELIYEGFADDEEGDE